MQHATAGLLLLVATGGAFIYLSAWLLLKVRWQAPAQRGAWPTST